MQEQETLRQDIDDIRIRLDALENGHEELTFDALYALRKEVDGFDKRLADIENAPEKETYSYGVSGETLAYGTPLPQEPELKHGHVFTPISEVTKAQSTVKKKLSEANIGKYGIGVLAAALILLAVGVAASSFWWAIPSVGKFFIILGLGAVMTATSNYFLLKKKDSKNGFWLSIMGCGAGVTFCAIASGTAVWKLYGTMIAGLLFISWFCIHYALSFFHQSRIFFIVTYIGGYLSICLAVFSLGKEIQFYQQIGLSCMLAAILAVGILGNLGFRSRALWISNALFAILSAFTLSNMIPEYPICVLTVTRFLLCYVAFICLQFVFTSDSTAAFVIRGVVTFLSAALTMNAFLAIKDTTISNIAFALFLFGTWFLLCCPQGMSLGLVPVFASLAEMVSKDLFGVSYLIPLLLAALVFALPSVQKDNRSRASAFLFYLLGLTLISHMNYTAEEAMKTAISIFVVALPPLTDYIMRTTKGKDISYSLTERTSMILLLSLSLWMLAPYKGWERALAVFVSVCCLLAHRHFVLWKALDNKDKDTAISSVLCIILFIMTHYVSYLFFWDENLSRKILLSIGLLTMAASVVCSCIIRDKGMLLTAGAILLCNANLRWAVLALSKGDMTLLASVLGLLLSVAFVFLGFKFQRKNIRLWGLTSIMIYVLWIALSVSFNSNSVGTVFMLLLGGLACFGVSFVYNQLSKAFDAQIPQTQQQEQPEQIEQTGIEQPDIPETAEIPEMETPNPD